MSYEHSNAQTSRARTAALLLAGFCGLLIVGSSFLFSKYGSLTVQAAFADEQTAIFDDMRTRALRSTAPSEIADCLQYVISYYPSGSKQQRGSKLDRVVERQRAAVVRDIVVHLRQITGQDLGNGPEPWIEKYAKK